MISILDEKNCVIIKQPKIEYENGRAFLKSDIIENSREYTLFFSVDSSYGHYLVNEVSDCFLLAVLQHAMIDKKDIISEAPISRHILYSLRTRLIPQLAKHTERYHEIKLDAVPSDIIFHGTAVGTGWSGGVDCLYTFINNYNCEEKSHQITHLVNINAGVFEGSEENIQKQFYKAGLKNKQIANQYNLSCIDIDTNIHLMMNENYLSVYPQRLCMSILALQKLFSIYYLSSSYEVTDLSYDEYNSGFYEYSLCSCLHTQNLRIYDSGTEHTRIEKISRIADSPIAQEHLHICVKELNNNCMCCGKCVRTIAALYALGKLNNFSKVFDLTYIYNNIDKILGDVYYNRRSKHYKEVLDLMETKGMELSKKALNYSRFLEHTHLVAQKLFKD